MAHITVKLDVPDWSARDIKQAVRNWDPSLGKSVTAIDALAMLAADYDVPFFYYVEESLITDG